MLKRLIFAGFLMLLAGTALAGDAEAVSQAINAFFSTGAGLAEKGIFMPDGQRLMGLLTVILIAWTGIWSLFSDGGFPEALAKLIKITFTAGICVFLLKPDTQQSLVKGFDYFSARAASATGAPVNMENPAQGVQTVMSAGLNAAMSLWRSQQSTEDKKSWMQIAASEGVMNLIVASIIEGGAKVIITGLIVVTLGIYVFVIATAMVLVQIGLTMAPIMVPWLLWDATAFLFSSWLKFMVTAGVVKIVASLNLGMTWGLLEAVKTLANSASATPVFDEFAYLTAALLALLMAFLMLQTYSIASGLVSGFPSVAMPNIRRPGFGPKPASNGPTKPPATNQ